MVLPFFGCSVSHRIRAFHTLQAEFSVLVHAWTSRIAIATRAMPHMMDHACKQLWLLDRVGELSTDEGVHIGRCLGLVLWMENYQNMCMWFAAFLELY